MFWTLFCTLSSKNRLFLVSFAPFVLFFVQLFAPLNFCVFMCVFSWLTHWIVAPALVGSSPTSRPPISLVSPLFTGVFVFSGFLFGRCARFVHPCLLSLSGRNAILYMNCGEVSSDYRLGKLDASGWLFTYKKKRTKHRRAPSVYTFVFLLIIAL